MLPQIYSFLIKRDSRREGLSGVEVLPVATLAAGYLELGEILYLAEGRCLFQGLKECLLISRSVI
jgi:hypothetical protein